MTNPIKKILFSMIMGYQKLISPLLPPRCRYYPTCSTYGLQAISWHGVKQGGWLTIKRISRCHPLGGHGVDFVPLPLYLFKFEYLTKSSLTVYQSGIVKSCCKKKSSEQNSINSPIVIFSVRDNFVYLDTMNYSYQLNKWLKKPIIDKN